MRPAWLIRAGLFLYDNLYWRDKMPGSRAVVQAPSEGPAPPVLLT